MERLLENISSKVPLSKDLEETIIAKFKLEEFPKNQLLLKEQQYCRRLYFLEEGTVRTFYYEKEKDISSWFYNEGHFFASWYSFYSQQPSFEYIESLEESKIYSIDYFEYQKLLETIPAFERFGRLLAEEQTAFIDLYSKCYMFLSAKERYNLLLHNFPDIELRVKLGYIASFLGISQETLSRIRSRK
ncbi:MAG: Crp/Fnr family transcriptional regulator [Aureispira sp.]|nr:Crp/Fnr family transcriptional regulator [Aureispira sp.]